MPKKPSLTEEQMRQYLLENPEMGQRAFCAKFKVSEKRWSRFYNEVKAELTEKREELNPNAGVAAHRNKWVYDKHYTYNPGTDTYVTFLRSAPKPIVVDGETHRAMQRAYSNWDGQPASINQICRTFSFPRPWFIEYKERHGWTHDKEPFTSEEVRDRPGEEMVEEALEQKRNVLYQEFEKRKWQEVQADADRWRALQKDMILPLNSAIEQWKPFKPFISKATKDVEKFSLVVTASDWQIGLKAMQENLTSGGDWNLAVGKKALEKYLEAIAQDVRRFKLNWGPCYLFNLGDLPHGMRGFTEGGTPLITDATKRQQYDAVFSLLTYLIEGLYAIFGEIEEVGVAGNHEGFDWYAIARALQERYRGQDKIRISADNRMVVYKKIGKTLFVLTHGKNPFGYKFKYAVRDNDKRSSQVQQEILRVMWKEIGQTQPELLKDVVQVAFIQGDNHFYKHIEKGMYEDMQFGTMSRGDDYADANRLFSRPSQSCLLISYEHGIRAPLRYYFDTLMKEKS